MEKNVITFNQDSPEIIHLCSVDPLLKTLILKIGDYNLTLRDDHFISLVKSIIGQQLSVAAARTISSRLGTLFPDITPHILLDANEETLRQIGISYSKIKYIKDLSSHVINNSLNLESLNQLEDEVIIKQLTMVKGIGKWTAEMFLIFSLGRLNILSADDVGLKRGIKWLYTIDTTPNNNEINNLRNLWSPYSTVASLYLWEIVNRGFEV